MSELADYRWTWVARDAVSVGYGPLGGRAPSWVVAGVTNGRSVFEAWTNPPPQVSRWDLARWLEAQGVDSGEAAAFAKSFARSMEQAS